MATNSNIFEVGRASIRYSNHNIYAGLQHELMLYAGKGGKFTKLSKKCGGHPVSGTISKIAYGETKQPRFTSVLLLFLALGFNISAER